MTRRNVSRSLAIGGLGLLAGLAAGLFGFMLPSQPNECRLVEVKKPQSGMLFGYGPSLWFCRNWGRESLGEVATHRFGFVSGSHSWERLPDWTRWTGMLDDRWRHVGASSLCAAGWPMRSLVVPITKTGFEWSELRPLWIGMALNTVGTSMLLEIAWLGTLTFRRVRRHRSGQCMQCGYRLVDAPRCPECGSAATSARPIGRRAFVPLVAWSASLFVFACVYTEAQDRYDREWAMVDCSSKAAMVVEDCVTLVCPEKVLTAEEWERDGIDTLLAMFTPDPPFPPCVSDRHWALNAAIEGTSLGSLEHGTIIMYETSSDGPRVGDMRDYLERVRTEGRAPVVISAPGFYFYPDSEWAIELLKWSVD